MRTEIPRPIISVLADNLPDLETHATLNSLFLYADAPGESPEGNKNAKVQEWLLRVNKETPKPLVVLGKLLEKYMELPEEDEISFFDTYAKNRLKENQVFKEKLIKILSRYNLTYVRGGNIIVGSTVSSQNLKDLIQEKDIPAINLEFERALKSVDSEPLEAISAACNILESICKVYIDDEQLSMPSKQTLRFLWKVVSQDLNFDPSKLQDDDLKKVISGLYSIVDGISALRTHGSSAHGQGRKMYKPEPRHARLAVNSAHSLALFILETWNHNKIK
ncbi:abortive infection family protein [uncultured Psychrobacter sp.]|uniref:abortive infection family protein n=1 Tax=uncultured Psychrobacter sp. TaxID=259303 RepID=UPI0032B2EC45|tara:strand:+ start:461 stop:1291 length:831 start_codon:yes stop_codon:yes gene_type:complete